MENIFVQDNFSRTIAQNISLCRHLFERYMGMPNIVSDPTLIDDQRARLAVWASDVDVFGPHVPNTSLEYRLRDDPALVNIIYDLLDVIYDHLISRKSLIADIRLGQVESQPDESLAIVKAVDDQYSGGDQAQTNDSLITDTIGGTIKRLYELRSVIRESTATSKHEK